MAQLLDYNTFIFNGVSSERYSLFIVSTGDVNEERIFGLNSSFEYEDSIGDRKLFSRRKNDYYKFDVEIMKLDAWNGVIPMSEKEYDDVIRWLMVDEAKPLQVGSIVHYGFFNDGREFHNPRRQGIIKLVFESASPYPYSAIMTNVFRVKLDKTIELENKSNINKNVYMDIDIEKTSANGDVTIINKRTGKSFKVKNLELGEQIKILGDGLMEVESITYPKKNMYPNLEYSVFPYLVYGRNNIKIIGDCKIRIRYQYPIANR
jgi:hypothetical protein